MKAITPIIERQCRVKARSLATQFANESCLKNMENLTYEDLCTIERDKEDRIRLIKMNSVNINNLNSKIVYKIRELYRN